MPIRRRHSRARHALLARGRDERQVRARLADVVDRVERPNLSAGPDSRRTYLGWSSWSDVKSVPSTSDRMRWMSSARGRGFLPVACTIGESEGVEMGVSMGVPADEAEGVSKGVEVEDIGRMRRDRRRNSDLERLTNAT